MDEQKTAPRLIISGLAGDAGKTMISLALLLALQRRQVPLRAFKKGPDYIDPAWLGWAAGHPARNLDTYLFGPAVTAASFIHNSIPEGLNLVEGARGLFDGFDTAGTHSTAELAKLLRAPLVLVLDATKMTRTGAALVFGCQKFDAALNIAGVILNRVNGKRHEHILRTSIEQSCGIPVVGAVPKISADDLVITRHLGLMTPQEHGPTANLEGILLDKVAAALDLDRLLSLAKSAPGLRPVQESRLPLPDGAGLKIGVLKDTAFTFYYAENLEMLERTGAELVSVSALNDGHLPENLHALYIGGGFPETHAERLAENRAFFESLRTAAEGGLPIYAECGGLMILSEAIRWRGTRYEMARVLPFEVEVCSDAQGHGYAEVMVDTPNPFFDIGTTLRGHEFHYSRILVQQAPTASACTVCRGSGCWQGRDAALVHNVWAAYTHLHALATPEWTRAMVSAARAFAQRKLPRAATVAGRG